MNNSTILHLTLTLSLLHTKKQAPYLQGLNQGVAIPLYSFVGPKFCTNGLQSKVTNNSILEFSWWLMDIQKHPYFGLFPSSNVQLKHILEAGSASIFK